MINYRLLHNYLGQGPLNPDTKIIIFGNEFGLASDTIENFINVTQKFVDEGNINNLFYEWKSGFLLNHPDKDVLNSQFIKSVSKLILAITSKDSSYFNDKYKEMNDESIKAFIKKELHRQNTCVLNLRPLPRPSEKEWIYDIDRKKYLDNWNFTKKNHKPDHISAKRIINLILALMVPIDCLTIGVGDKKNKRAFFEKYVPRSRFEEITLPCNKIIFVDKLHKVILTDYFDSRHFNNQALRQLFFYIRNNKLMP